MSAPGIGAMLGVLGGNASTVEAYNKSIGKVIASAVLDTDSHEDGALILSFTDGSKLTLADNGRSCCEARYITCDDDLACLSGKVLNSINLKEGPEETDEYGEPHETMFVEVQAADGTSVILTTHNEHNGYYGGFWITLSFDDGASS